jgi:hypothetical protein
MIYRVIFSPKNHPSRPGGILVVPPVLRVASMDRDGQQVVLQDALELLGKHPGIGDGLKMRRDGYAKGITDIDMLCVYLLWHALHGLESREIMRLL